MIKRLYLANGQLTAPLDIYSEDIAVDATLAAMLDANLVVGDHCYLTLRNKGVIEVVKIRRDYEGYQVHRGQDSTSKQGLPTGTSITYMLTMAEILDGISLIPYHINADGTGYAYVTGGNGTWVIGAPQIHADTLGGISARAEDNVLYVFDHIGMFGCCDGSLTGAPHIPGPIFYLTSMIYGYEGFDIMTPQPKDKNGNTIPPLNFDSLPPWYLLTQPFIYELYSLANMVVLPMQLFGGQKTFTAPVDKYIDIDMGVLDWQIYGTAGQFTAPPDKYTFADMFPLKMVMYGGEIVYDKGLDKYVWPTMAVLDWTLNDG